MTRRAFTLNGNLGKLIVLGSRLTADVAEAVVAGSVSLSTAEVTQLDLTLVDNDFDLLRSGLFSAGTPTKAGSRCDYGNLAMEVRALEVAPRGNDNVLTVTARSLHASAARRTKGKNVKQNLSPTDYIRRSARDFGLKFVGQPSAKRKNIARQKDESEWDTWQRLASELGYDCFEAANVLYFGKPTWLIEHTKELRVSWRGTDTGDAVDELPRCRRTGDDDKRLATVNAKLRGDLGESALPGMRFTLDGVPTFAGRYMVDTVTVDLGDDQAVTVGASTAINPKPQPPPKKIRAKGGDTSSSGGTDTTSTTGATGAKSAAAFVGVALAQLGDSYVWGAHPSGAEANPTAFDCLVAGTLVATDRGQVPIELVTSRDRVLTRAGWRRVRRSWMVRRDAEVVEVEVAGRVLCGTRDHRVWTAGRGWVALGDLTLFDTVVLCQTSPSPKSSTLKASAPSGSTSRAARTTATRTRRARPTAPTSSGPGRSSTVPSGKPRTVPSPTATRSTTSTTTPATTGSTTSPSWDCPSTDARAKPTAGSMPTSVPSAAPSSRRTATPARPAGSATSSASGPVSTGKLGRAPRPAGRADVYDLTVDGEHEFFANGVLVHNCSGLVAYAAGRVGVPFAGTSSSQYAASIKISVEQAINTRGAILHTDGHIAISLGNGQTVEAANPEVGVVSYGAAGRFSGGGLIPGMRY